MSARKEAGVGRETTHGARAFLQRRREAIASRFSRVIEHTIDHPIKTLAIGAGLMIAGVILAPIPVVGVAVEAAGIATWIGGVGGLGVRVLSESSGTYEKPATRQRRAHN